MVVRNSDYEYAPALDQSVFSYKKTFNPNPKPENGGSGEKISGKNNLADTLCK